MRKLFILTFGILFLVSCGTETKKSDRLFQAEADLEDGTAVYLAELGKGNQPIALDTVEVKNEKIEIELPKVDFQTLNILTIDGVNGNLLFINENEEVEVVINKDEIRKSEIKGGKSNQLLKEYFDRLIEGNDKIIAATDGMDQQELQDPEMQMQMRNLQGKIEQENTEFRKKAIAENPNELASILIFSDMLRTRQVPQNEMQELFEALSKDLKNTYIGKEIGKEIKGSAAVAVGNKAPSFSAKTPEGEELALEDALGKYTLLDFWAAWCKPCRVENPNIVKVYNKYKDKGFNVLGVSLDRTEDAWIKAIEQDELPWNQVSNLKFWQDPIAKEYNIKAITASFLLDEDGVIIATNLSVPALEQKIEELLGDQ